MQFLKKHKKKIIISTAIVLVIILAVILAIFLIQKGKENNQENNDLTERAKELIRNNYIFSYLYQGDVKVSDGSIEVDGTTYYFVSDDNLTGISSWADITNLIKNTFVEAKRDLYYEKIENGHQYFETDDMLYVAKSDNICQKIPSANVNDLSISLIEDDKMLINWSNQSIYAYKENDNWYLGTDNFYCMDEYTP